MQLKGYSELDRRVARGQRDCSIAEPRALMSNLVDRVAGSSGTRGGATVGKRNYAGRYADLIKHIYIYLLLDFRD